MADSASRLSASDRINVTELTRILRGSWPEVRQQARLLAADPAYHAVEGQSLSEKRERVLSQLLSLAEGGFPQQGLPEHLGGKGDPGGNVARFEEFVLADPSLQVKAGVQWGLFGAAVLHLGTASHHERLLPDIMALKVPGGFAMTETGHGSDVASIATTATYDPAAQEFVINTPFRAAWKDYLGNAALHATAAVVFAQLIVAGVNHGVHCLYVPIRDPKTKEFLPGIGGDDDGWKGGLNGVDNGRLHFDHVRVPRENLLNRYGDVAADGSYTSPIASPGRRFFTMIDTLVQGRVSLDGAATVASALALHIAIVYGSQRRQFLQANDVDEEVLLDYQQHQRRLLPRLATTYAQYFSHDVLLKSFDAVFRGGAGDTPAQREALETRAAALKPLSTWHALDTLQEAREACGGAGFLSENRLVDLRQDLDIFTTFEGDNTVLLQLVSKRLLTNYAKRFHGASKSRLAKYAAGQLGDRVLHESGARALGQTVTDLVQKNRPVALLSASHEQRALLNDRVETMVAAVAGRLNRVRSASRVVQAEAFNAEQHEAIETARAWGELQQWAAFTAGLEAVKDASTREVLTALRDLFFFGLLEKHLDWYLINGRLAPKRAEHVPAQINRLVASLRPHALDLVASFDFQPGHVRAPIALGAEEARQEEACAYTAAERAAATAPTPEPRPGRGAVR